MEQEKINANVNSLSQKLLEGCKLLSESCPDTNVPLVSTPDGRMYSVGNGAYYVREGGELLKVPGEPTVAQLSAPASPDRGMLGFTPGAPTGSVQFPSAAPPEQSLSSRVAAKLLEGFTLLSESCPVTSVPLVQDPSGRILSVGTGKWYERTGGELLETHPATAMPPPSMTPFAAQPPAPNQMHAYGTPALPTPPPVAPPVRQLPPVPPFSVHPTTPLPSAQSAYGSAASAAVADAVLKASMTPGAFRAQPLAGVGTAAIKVSAQEGVAVLGGRLNEAVAALSDAPIRDAGMYVTMIKEIALAIAALKAL